MNRDEAAKFFVDLIVKGVLKPCSSSAEKGWKTGMPKSLYGDISTWYLGLPERDQQMVKSVSDDVMHSIIFRIMSVLDGIAGFSDVNGKAIHVALYVQEFANRDALSEGKVEEQTHINPFSQHDLLLHDIFQQYLDQAGNNPPLE